MCVYKYIYKTVMGMFENVCHNLHIMLIIVPICFTITLYL